MTAPDGRVSVEVAVLRCPSDTHGRRPPVAAVHGRYLPGHRTEVRVAYCVPCATRLAMAGLFVADR